MEIVDYKFDQQLADFITDFSDGNLDGIELQVFNEYLKLYTPVRSFAMKAKRGRQALLNCCEVKAADDFEEKLVRRIAEERVVMTIEEERHKDLETVS